jgi:lipoyl(octanoyl) transferase
VAVDDIRTTVADAVCDALDGVLPVREHPVARVASAM